MMRRSSSILWLLVLALGVGIAVSIGLGPVRPTHDILLYLRLPRVLLGVLVGMALATAGGIFQGLLRNPLADPYILGTSSGASFGVLLASLCGWHQPIALYGLALLFAFGSVLVVNRLALTDGKTPVQTLILAGVLVSTFLNSVVFLGISIFYRETFSAIFFMLGTLTENNPMLLKISGGLIVISTAAAWYLSSDLNVLAQGEETAHHLGLEPERAKKILFLVASTLVAASVAVSGMIGFIGLMVPHIMRAIVGPDHRVLIPSSALAGALLLILMDAAARTVAAPIEIPVGVLTAIAGTPFFIYLLRKKKGEMF